VPLTGMRRTIAKRTLQNWQSIPHVFVTLDVDMGAAMALRKQVNEGRSKEEAISVNDFVLKASALALVTHPQLNVSYSEEGIQQHSAVNLSVAVALENGLVAPVIVNAQDRSLGSIAREARRLIGLVREGKLSQDILNGGTFQVSNLGMFGVSEFGSIISLPQAGALAVGAIQRVPGFVGESDEVVAKQIMKITVSADHRALDGAEAAKFGAEVRRLLENPMALLVG
jgi:pyruvate dehydrogenase E2 component (dihydrolipoamide acetyltransferase)